MFRYLLLIFFTFSSQALGFAGFDECSFFRTEINSERTKKDFDDVAQKKYNYHGLIFETGFQDGIRPYIDRIHPDVFDSDDSKQAYEKSFEIRLKDIITINGIDTLNMSDEEFDAEIDKNEILLSFAGVEDKYLFKRKDFYSRELIITPDIKKINNIDTKSSTFDIVFEVDISWNDYRFSEIAYRVAKKGGEIDKETGLSDGGFFCYIPFKFFQELGYIFPDLKIQDFTNTLEREKPEYVLIDYFPPPCGNFDCIEEEEKYGIVQFSFIEKFQGSVFQKFSLKKFPFDSHEITLDLFFNYFYFFDEPYRSNISEQTQLSNYSNFSSPEWEFVDYFSGYGSIYLPNVNARVPTLSMIFEIDRQYSYFLFKIMFPIICLLGVCWATFWMTPRELESRVTISIVCLLSLIAYNFIIDQDIPKLAYLTFLDQFILISYLFAGLPTIQTVASHRILERHGLERALNFDRSSRILIPFAYFFSMLTLVLLTDVSRW